MNIPQHIGIIMDGNGRWAKKRALPRAFGHRAGTKALHTAVEVCGDLGVRYLTVYVLSTENFARPADEVSSLMNLLIETVNKEIESLCKNNVRLNTIGDISRLPEKTYLELIKGVENTKNNTGLTLTLALSYGGRNEIVRAAKIIAEEAIQNPSLINSLNEEKFSKYLYTSNIPDPELIIRTGGDMRISNFLLWQAAYSELFITDTLWPDFNKESLMEAITNFNKRQRRFGKVIEE